MVVGVGLQGREQDGGDVINLVALGLFYGLFITAVFADARDHPLVRAVRLLDPTGFRDGKSVVLVAIGVLVLASLGHTVFIGTGCNVHIVLDHLAVFPDLFTANIDSNAICIFPPVVYSTAYNLDLEQAGAGFAVCFQSCDLIVARKIYDKVCFGNPFSNLRFRDIVRVMDVQHTLHARAALRFHCAILEVDNSRPFRFVWILLIRVHIYNFCAVFSDKCASIKGHSMRRIIPQGIIAIWAVECRILECRRSISPIRGTSIKGAIYNFCNITMSKTKIVAY